MKAALTEARSPFASRRREATYLDAYRQTLERWTVAYEELDLDGPFGTTHVIASGPRDGAPLVLLHGFGMSSTMWARNVRTLAASHRVFAVDVLGQAGRSRPRAPLATRADCVAWMRSVLDALGVDRVALAGVSYGGWLTLDFALAAPERLWAIVLISPGGLLPLSRQMLARALVASLVPWQRCCDLLLMRWISVHGAVGDAEQRALTRRLARQLYLGLRVRGELRRGGAPALPFTDDELRSLRVPALLLIGESEVLYDAAAALARAQRLIPTLVGQLIADASHDLATRRAEVVDEKILAFLAPLQPRRGSPQPARGAHP